MRVRVNGKDENIEAASVLDILKVRNVEPRMEGRGQFQDDRT